MSRETLKSLVMGSIMAVVLIAAALMLRNFSINSKGLGEELVRLLYEFDTVKDARDNSEIVKRIVTSEVYDQLTVDNEERYLTTYLKFRNNPCRVVIIRSTKDYVLYSLNTESVDSRRIFALFYSVNSNGTIDYVREVECIDFVETSE